MNLGNQLANTIAEIEASKLAATTEAWNADLEKIRTERADFQHFLDGIWDKIVKQIQDTKVPNIKVSSWDRIKWLTEVNKESKAAKYSDLWVKFLVKAEKEHLLITLADCHDGVGIESWVEIRVRPL